jgi:hypothetical protein
VSDSQGSNDNLIAIDLSSGSSLSNLFIDEQVSATPSSSPSNIPTSHPTERPTSFPSLRPTANPTPFPTQRPSAMPTVQPTAKPTAYPTAEPTQVPTALPTSEPTAYPTPRPTYYPTAAPTAKPTADPTAIPTQFPTAVPTAAPTLSPTAIPTSTPTSAPTKVPTMPPTSAPTPLPTYSPTKMPTSRPTEAPTNSPTKVPTLSPTKAPTQVNCNVAKVESSVTGTIIFTTNTLVRSNQMQKLMLQTDETTDSMYACVLGSVTKYGFEPPFNFGIVIDVSGSTGSTFAGTPVGDVNGDGYSNTILDAEIASIIKVLESIANAASLNNKNVDIGLITFSHTARYHGSFTPLDPANPTQINPILRATLLSLRSGGTTNFDDALDKSIDYFRSAPTNRDNVLFFLSDGIPNVSGDGDGEVAATSYDNQPNALRYSSELQLLDNLKVARIGVGVGRGSQVSTNSGLDMIDNTPDPVTGMKAQQVTSSDELTKVLLQNPVVGTVVFLKIEVNGIVQSNISASQVQSGPAGYTFGQYIVSGLVPTNGYSNIIKATVTMDYDGNVGTTADQLTVFATTVVKGTA